jgi:hypothetical protein
MCPAAKPHLRRSRSLLLRLRRRHMRVKLCARCPYLPCDLAGHYDPKAVLHLCAKCDGEQQASSRHDSRKIHRRQKCATVLNIIATAQRSVAQSVTESLVSSGTTPGEPRSARRSAMIASRPDRRVTADGYAGSKPPDDCCGTNHAAISRSSVFRNREAAH